MQVKITSNGILTVTAETETESYALQCWWSRYGTNDGCVSPPTSGIGVRWELPAEQQEETD